MPPLCSFLLLVAVLHVSRGSYVPCEACDRKALSLCAPVPAGCRERVKEPGCGCCLTCALDDGQPCGVYTGPCARGLRCLPKDGEEKPLHALLHGRGACRNERLLKLIRGEGGAPGDAKLRAPGFLGVHTKVHLYAGRGHVGSLKIHAVNKARERSRQLARERGGLDNKPHAMDKPQPTAGPCRTRLDNVIQSMRDSPQVAALSLYIPNCDKNGFFKRKQSYINLLSNLSLQIPIPTFSSTSSSQCKPSRGRKRGICWCVNRLGIKLAGSNYSGGDLQCKGPDDSNSNE
ncbi:hypothetical protein CRUP_026903 [Coryphaenoides rupestris]|nr:hypothetical protein CRUP_026903 [Coryphaenoides rupestris]